MPLGIVVKCFYTKINECRICAKNATRVKRVSLEALWSEKASSLGSRQVGCACSFVVSSWRFSLSYRRWGACDAASRTSSPEKLRFRRNVSRLCFCAASVTSCSWRSAWLPSWFLQGSQRIPDRAHWLAPKSLRTHPSQAPGCSLCKGSQDICLICCFVRKALLRSESSAWSLLRCYSLPAHGWARTLCAWRQ